MASPVALSVVDAPAFIDAFLCIPGMKALCHRYNVVLAIPNTIFYIGGWVLIYIDLRLPEVDPNHLPYNISQIQRNSQAERVFEQLATGEAAYKEVTTTCSGNTYQVIRACREFVVMVQDPAQLTAE